MTRLVRAAERDKWPTLPLGRCGEVFARYGDVAHGVGSNRPISQREALPRPLTNCLGRGQSFGCEAARFVQTPELERQIARVPKPDRGLFGVVERLLPTVVEPSNRPRFPQPSQVCGEQGEGGGE